MVFFSASALMCKMCDRYVSCANEISEQCPPYTSCYTIKSNGVGQESDVPTIIGGQNGCYRMQHYERRPSSTQEECC
uniref:Secreted protein n=1 Tax=Angiostrongylus cantonensis TaxID=6313 RepID=A0A0K0DC77_ANGCA